MRNYRYSKGFSMIELMIVVAIIGVLAAVAIPNYSKYVTRASLADLMVAAQEGKTDLLQYIAKTGDATCAVTTGLIASPVSSAPNNRNNAINDFTNNPRILSADWGSSPSAPVIDVGGSVIRGPACTVVVTGKSAAFGGNTPTIVYTANPTTSGKINYFCTFFAPAGTALANAVPDGCVYRSSGVPVLAP